MSNASSPLPSSLISSSPVPPFAGLAGLAPGDALDTARVMGVVTALAAEVFVLKAEVQRLRLALAANGVVDEPALDAAGQSAPMARWLGEEEAAFGAAILQPFTQPDAVPDVTRFMAER